MIKQNPVNNCITDNTVCFVIVVNNFICESLNLVDLRLDNKNVDLGDGVTDIDDNVDFCDIKS